MIMEVYFMASEVLLNELRSIKKELEKSSTVFSNGKKQEKGGR